MFLYTSSTQPGDSIPDLIDPIQGLEQVYMIDNKIPVSICRKNIVLIDAK